MLSQNLLTATRKLLNGFFLINDKSAGDVMSDGQVEIVASILYRIKPRVACISPTGYGKSEAAAMAVILRTVLFNEPFIVGSVKYGTSEIIMKKVIEHIFDSPRLVQELEIDSSQKLSTLKRERNKSAVNFKKGGSIKIISLHGADDDVSRAIGEHAPNIILDESPLLTPTKYLIILKILEGTGNYNDTFLFELGNAVNRNHFMNNVLYNPNYLHLNISLDQAIAEGRLDPQSIEEKRGLPFFEQFYECRFPQEDEIDAKGYRQLITSEDIAGAEVGLLDPSEEPMKLGVDVGGGGDYNVYCLRQGNKSWFETWNRSNDTMTNVNEVIRIIDKYSVLVKDEKGNPKKDADGKEVKKRLLKPEDVYIDDIGIGRGVTDRLIELGYSVNGVSVGEKPQDPTKYKNIKAENFWLAAQWIKQKKDGKYVNKLLTHEKWQQMAWIKYKVSTDKVLQIEPKEDLKAREGKSPDYAEAFMLTWSTGKGKPGILWL